MSEFNKLRYRVDDIELDVERIKNLLTRTKCLDMNVGSDGMVNCSCACSVSSGSVSYEILADEGSNVKILLSTNGEVVIEKLGKMASGEMLVKSRKINSIQLSITGSGLSMARLRLTGAGLKIT